MFSSYPCRIHVIVVGLVGKGKKSFLAHHLSSIFCALDNLINNNYHGHGGIWSRFHIRFVVKGRSHFVFGILWRHQKDESLFRTCTSAPVFTPISKLDEYIALIEWVHEFVSKPGIDFVWSESRYLKAPRRERTQHWYFYFWYYYLSICSETTPVPLYFIWNILHYGHNLICKCLVQI